MAAEKLSTLDKIASVLGQVWAVIETIFKLPSIVATYINQFLGQLLPWNPSINPTISTILALAITIMWYPKWSKVTKFFGKLPLGIILAVYLHYSLFRACQGVTSSGWFSAIILLGLTAAINYWPQFKSFLAWIGLGFGATKRLAGKGIRGAGKLAGATKKLGRDPVHKEFIKVLDQRLDDLLALYERQGLETKAKLERLSEFVDEMKTEADPRRRLIIDGRFEALKARHALVDVSMTPTAEVALRSLDSFG